MLFEVILHSEWVLVFVTCITNIETLITCWQKLLPPSCTLKMEVEVSWGVSASAQQTAGYCNPEQQPVQPFDFPWTLVAALELLVT